MPKTPKDVQQDMMEAEEKAKVDEKFELKDNWCLTNTVPLPYHAGGKDFSEEELREYERECLVAIQHKLRFGVCTGKPYRALLLEYVLGGNGGQLSADFLAKLAPILEKYCVKVVADEVLTGGGRGGPSMAMTSQQPKAFQRCVSYITMGKWFGAAVVLQRRPNGPQSVLVASRGCSTHAKTSHICLMWKIVQQKIADGCALDRRRNVTKKLGLGDPETVWGVCLLVYSFKARKRTFYSLKLRDLPMLANTAIQPGPRICTDWTRSKVTRYLMEIARAWIAQVFQQQMAEDIMMAEMLIHTDKQQPDNSQCVCLFRVEDFQEALVKEGKNDYVLSLGRAQYGKAHTVSGTTTANFKRLANFAAGLMARRWNSHFREGTDHHNAIIVVRKGRRRVTKIGVVKNSFSCPLPVVVSKGCF